MVRSEDNGAPCRGLADIGRRCLGLIAVRSRRHLGLNQHCCQLVVLVSSAETLAEQVFAVMNPNVRLTAVERVEEADSEGFGHAAAQIFTI